MAAPSKKPGGTAGRGGPQQSSSSSSSSDNDNSMGAYQRRLESMTNPMLRSLVLATGMEPGRTRRQLVLQLLSVQRAANKTAGGGGKKGGSTSCSSGGGVGGTRTGGGGGKKRNKQDEVDDEQQRGEEDVVGGVAAPLASASKEKREGADANYLDNSSFSARPRVSGTGHPQRQPHEQGVAAAQRTEAGAAASSSSTGEQQVLLQPRRGPLPFPAAQRGPRAGGGQHNNTSTVDVYQQAQQFLRSYNPWYPVEEVLAVSRLSFHNDAARRIRFAPQVLRSSSEDENGRDDVLKEKMNLRNKSAVGGDENQVQDDDFVLQLRCCRTTCRGSASSLGGFVPQWPPNSISTFLGCGAAKHLLTIRARRGWVGELLVEDNFSSTSSRPGKLGSSQDDRKNPRGCKSRYNWVSFSVDEHFFDSSAEYFIALVRCQRRAESSAEAIKHVPLEEQRVAEERMERLGGGEDTATAGRDHISAGTTSSSADPGSVKRIKDSEAMISSPKRRKKVSSEKSKNSGRSSLSSPVKITEDLRDKKLLECPLSLGPIEVPVRGKNCAHVQCCDGETFLDFVAQQEARNAKKIERYVEYEQVADVADGLVEDNDEEVDEDLVVVSGGLPHPRSMSSCKDKKQQGFTSTSSVTTAERGTRDVGPLHPLWTCPVCNSNIAGSLVVDPAMSRILRENRAEQEAASRRKNDDEVILLDDDEDE